MSTESKHQEGNNANTVLYNVFFSRELFVETIGELEKQYDHDRKCSEAFRVILPNDYVTNYQNHMVCNQIIKLLQIAMNDEHQHSWIEYYIHELDFGKEYTVGCARTKDGENIDLSNAGSLWDYLNIT